LFSLDEFTFKSRRQNSFPFALTLYVDGMIDSRISVCCEYKHKLNVPLGSKSASFAIVNVEGGRPCQTFVFQFDFEFIGAFSCSENLDVDSMNIYQQRIKSQRQIKQPKMNKQQ